MALLSFIPRRYLAVIAIALALIMSVMDGTIVNVALPTLAREFGTSPSTTIWIVNAYQLTITVTLLSFSALGDIHGYKKIFLFGTGVFCVMSLACSLTTSFTGLTVARILQGIGAAAIMSVTTALLRIIYPPQYIGRGMSINAMVVAVSIAAGPSLAGAILSVASWHWLFAINVPLGICAFVAGYFLLPQNPPADKVRKFDKTGSVASALTFGLLIYTLEGIAHNESLPLIIIQIVLLAVIGTLFIRRELREETPILPVDLMKIPIFALSVFASVTSFTAQLLAMVSLPFYLQNVAGRNEVETGLLLTPWPVATILTAPIAGRLIEKFHPGLLGAIGMLIYSVGLYLLATLPPAPTNAGIAWRLMLCGAGFGLFQTPNNSTMIASAPPHRSGGANGMQGTARLLGQTMGTTLVALIFRMAAPAQGMQTCMYVALGFALTAAVISSLRVSQPAPMRKK
ncbi:MAG: MFS transporter [Parabacteroides sp.]|nr:MFS transporter [Parabacteroides sp.]